jgi:SOS-response transcriptional repressor LexA
VQEDLKDHAVAGTVRVSREFFDDPAFKAEPMSEREAFLWMIMEASWKPREKRVGRATVALQRGEFAASIRFMQEAWGWASPRRVHHFIGALQKRNMVEMRSGTDVTVVRLCNYDKYQSQPTPRGTVAERETERSRNTGGTNENKDAIRGKEEAIAPKPARACSFQAFWDAYPHRDGVKRARAKVEAKYRAHVKAGVPEQAFLDAVQRLKADKRVKDGFARDPLTWINQRGWEDEAPAEPADSHKLDVFRARLREGKPLYADYMTADHTEALIAEGALSREDAKRMGLPLAADPIRRTA